MSNIDEEIASMQSDIRAFIDANFDGRLPLNAHNIILNLYSDYDDAIIIGRQHYKELSKLHSYIKELCKLHNDDFSFSDKLSMKQYYSGFSMVRWLMSYGGLDVLRYLSYYDL